MKLDVLFPNLASDGFKITSAATKRYNCIAWAATVETKWFWPDDDEHSTWLDGVLKEESLEAFVQFYLNHGFAVCSHSDLERGFEKVAIYLADEIPQHAARQLPSGLWTSKLGELEDIEHTLRGLEGDIYGAATVYLKRPVKSA